jgi:hypothetical protein
VEWTANGSVDLLAAIAKDFVCISPRLPAQFVKVIGQAANHMPQFVQENRYLRGERISDLRADSV